MRQPTQPNTCPFEQDIIPPKTASSISSGTLTIIIVVASIVLAVSVVSLWLVCAHRNNEIQVRQTYPPVPKEAVKPVSRQGQIMDEQIYEESVQDHKKIDFGLFREDTVKIAPKGTSAIKFQPQI